MPNYTKHGFAYDPALGMLTPRGHVKKPAVGGGGSGIARVTGVSAYASDFASSPTRVVTYAGAISSGDLLIVAGGGYGATSISSVTDSESNSYTILDANDGGNNTVFIAYAIANGAATPTVTVTSSPTVLGWFVGVDAFSGVDGSPLDVDGGISNGSSTSASDSLTTSAADTLIIGALIHDGYSDETLTEDGAYTLSEEEEGTSLYQGGAVIYRIVSSAGSYTPSWTISGSTPSWAVYSASFE